MLHANRFTLKGDKSDILNRRADYFPSLVGKFRRKEKVVGGNGYTTPLPAANDRLGQIDKHDGHVVGIIAAEPNNP
ncbi:unnamed protein product [Rhizoctonia solani]|uniref:Uncharacterized protein n=1 Tax=Rhizoctonia solani TaxID=456999 RepID=A0A8H3HKZ2_9AGAM|nr:unnamed protein product [Rhizoctonia solani]CAE7062103.1 unnamed protein product [Rhizoctonia solani]